MAIDKKKSLDIMRRCFPSWSDIRKRTKKSKGGSLLRAYAEEFGRLDGALEDYKKMFFLVNHKGHEDEVPSTLKAALIGKSDDVTIDSISCTVTDSEAQFLENLGTMALRAGAYILFHDRLAKEEKAILYSVNGSQYRAELFEIPIWNIFDEFAKFAGIERFEGETNTELEARTYAVFKDFPNPTDAGLKRAIRDALVPVADIDESEISISPIDDAFDMSDAELADIYEQFAQFNRDLFRTKVWNLDNWENGFQKQGWMSHSWDKPMPVTKDGVGSNDSLKVAYLKDLDTTGFTDVDVTAYKRDFETAKHYVSKHPVEDAITLSLTRYGNTIQPVKVDFAVKAYDVLKLEHPENIRIRATRQASGVQKIAISDIATELYGVEVEERGLLEKKKDYIVRFTPKSSFSDMTIDRLILRNGTVSKNLLDEDGSFVFRGNTLVNKFVRAHATSLSDLSKNDNIIDTQGGLSIGPDKASGSFDIDVQGMENELIAWKGSCREVGIMGTAYIEAENGFELSDGVYTDTNVDSLGTLTIGGKGHEMTCNSFSFAVSKTTGRTKQGVVMVTILADDKEEKLTLRSGDKLERSYGSRIPVCISIQKYGQNAVSIEDIRMASYDVALSMSDGSSLQYLGSTTRLPDKIEQGVTLHVGIQPYTSANPCIEYVHIGGSLAGSCYEQTFSTGSMKEPRLDIKTDCNVSLYEWDRDTGRVTPVVKEKEYRTNNRYYNPYDEPGQIVIDTSAFSSITDSKPSIGKKYSGGTKPYITLASGESVDEITIVGTMTELVSDRSVEKYVVPDGQTRDWDVYATNAQKGLVLKSDKYGALELAKISHDDIGRRADSFSVTGLPDGVTAYFVYGDGSTQEVKPGIRNNSFRCITFSYDKAQEYIAYNSVSVITGSTDAAQVTNTFQPVLSLSQLHLYEIEKPTNLPEKTDLWFTETQKLICLGAANPYIHVETEERLDNKSRWDIEVTRVVNRCILSNEILLDEKYLVNGDYHELSEYIVEAPEGMTIHFKGSGEKQEKIEVPKVGIQKLAYSNVQNVSIRVRGIRVRSGYQVMEKEGIILWDDDTYAGETAKITYSVLTPVYLTYTSAYEDKLYDIVGLKEGTLKAVDTKRFYGLKDKEFRMFSLGKPDLVITKCSNPAFTSTYHDGRLVVLQMKDDERIAVKSGYIYDDGKEYYYFNDKFHDGISQSEGVEFFNVSRQGSDMIFHIGSKNVLPNSSMREDSMRTLCHFDFASYPLGGVSSMGRLTACESYNLWYLSNMDASLASAQQGIGIAFQSQDGEGCAALDITKYAEAGKTISLFADGVQPYLVKEKLAGGMPFAKSVFIDMDEAEALSQDGSIFCASLPEAGEEEKVYLVVAGESGKVDDIIISDEAGDLASLHKKNIDKMLLKFDESLPKNYEYDAGFTRDGAAYDDAVCGSDGTISTSSSIEYGLTKLHEATLTDCSISKADYKDGRITAVRNGAVIKTRPFYVRSSQSAKALYVKVNSILGGSRKGFDIEVYGSPTGSKGFTQIASATGTNLVTVPESKVMNYAYVVVRAKSGKVIDSIEAYAQYAEMNGIPLVSEPKNKGTFTSKVYDLGISANYKFDGVSAEEDGEVRYEVRGARKDKNDIVFTEWKGVGSEFENYRLFQFRTTIDGAGTTVKIDKYRMVAN